MDTKRLPAIALLLLAMILPACADRGPGSAGQGEAEADGLPKPARRAGPVTGMPDRPGPGKGTAVTGEPPAGNPLRSDVTPDPANPETGLLPGGTEPAGAAAESASQAVVATEPTPADAVAVIGDYYDAINSRSYARAYSLWSDNGRSSGQTPQQFADGFAGTASVTAEILPPGRVDAAAGSRYIEVPVAISASQTDGSVRRYVGAYVLRRAVVDGASAEQRAWRIGSADLREVKP
jgi:hypothetical protein